MAYFDLHDTDYVIKFKTGLAANINTTATKNMAVEGEPHYATDTDTLYIYDGTVNSVANQAAFDSRYARLASANTFTAANLFDLSSDAIAIRIQGDAAQTANLQTWENSGGTIMLSVQADGDLEFDDGTDIVFDTTTGTKIGTATNQKLGFFNATPVVQQAHIIDADGTLADITTKFNTLLAELEALGLIAAA